MSEFRIQKACPRLIDYVCIVGTCKAVIKSGHKVSSLVLKPQLLKRYPAEDHKDFPLPATVSNFCQPEGCTVLNAKKVGKKETAFFIFTLTDKDSGITRYGICLNFYCRFEATRCDGRPSAECYQLFSGEETFMNKSSLVKTSSDSAFSSDPRKVHSEEESDCDTAVGDSNNYFSADFEVRRKSGHEGRGKRRTKSNSSTCQKRRMKAGCTSSASVSTNSSSRTLTRGENSTGCVESRSDPDLTDEQSAPNRVKKSAVRSKKDGKFKPLRYYSLTSLCFLSHYPFVSNFRECITVFRQLVDGIQADISKAKKSGYSGCGTQAGPDNRQMQHLSTAWDFFINGTSGCSSCDAPETPPSRSRPPTSSSSSSSTGRQRPSRVAFHKIQEVEAWIANLLAVPVPSPGQTRVEVTLLPTKQAPRPPLIFALPDHTRFSLCDFPLHLPLELLGVNKCLQVLTLILLERKIVIQSQDYSALSFCILSLTKMIYPLEYVFPVIPLLPVSMTESEQLLLAPTPYIIGVPSNFFVVKRNFKIPEDIWIVDLDSANIKPQTSTANLEIPSIPEPDIKVLKNHLKQVLGGMPIQPIKNFDELPAESLTKMAENIQKMPPPSGGKSFCPFIFGNDVDSVDIALRVAMVRFFNSSNLLANFSDHTRTLRLLPRPIVVIQVQSLLKSRTKMSPFIKQLTATQAVEFYAEWSLTPTNISFHRVHNSVFDPVLIGDKPKWYAHNLKCIQYYVWSDNKKFSALVGGLNDKDELETDESGSDTDLGSTSSCSSFSDLVSEFQTNEGLLIGDDVLRDGQDVVDDTCDVEPNDIPNVNYRSCSFSSQMSCEDNEEIMQATGAYSPPEIYNETHQPLEDDLSPSPSLQDISHSTMRTAKPPTPIPKSFSMTDSEDEDGFHSAFKFCTRKVVSNDESESGPEAEEKASDEMAMELFSSIAKLTMNAQLSISDCEDDMPSFKSKSEPEKVQSVPIPISSNESQVPVAPYNHKDAFPIQQPTDEVFSQGSPFQDIYMKRGSQSQRQTISSSNYHSAFHQRQSSIKRHPYYPYQSQPCQQQPIEPKVTQDNVQEPKDEKKPSDAAQESSMTELLAAALVRSSAALTNPLRVPPPIPPRPLPFRIKNAQPLSNTSDKGNVRLQESPKQKLFIPEQNIEPKERVQPAKILDQKLQPPLTARTFGNPKEIQHPPSSESLPSTPRPSQDLSKQIELSTTTPTERKLLNPSSEITLTDDPTLTSHPNNISKVPTTSQAEEARQKKLEFFRALGQATLEDLEQQQKTAEEKTPRIASMSLFDSSIVSLSSYNRQTSAPSSQLSSSLPTYSNSNCNRQMSVPASWKEDPMSRSMQEKANSESLNGLKKVEEIHSNDQEGDETNANPETPSFSANGSTMTRSDSSMSNVSNFSFATQQLWTSISSDLSGLAAQTSNLFGGFLSGSRSSLQTNEEQPPMPQTPNRINKSVKEKDARPEARVGKPENKNVRGSTPSEQMQNRRSFKKKSGNAENQLLIQDIIDRVLLGEGIGWLRFNKLKKLMEEESNRAFALNYFSRTVKSRVSKNGHLQDYCLERPVWKGVLRIASSIVHGLEIAVTTATVGGMASAFHLLEIAHTHYWQREANKSISSMATSPFGSQETLILSQSNNTRNRLESRGTDEDSLRDAGHLTDFNDEESDCEWTLKDSLSRKSSQCEFIDVESDTQSIAGSEGASFSTNLVFNNSNVVNIDQIGEKIPETKTQASQGQRFRHGKLQKCQPLGNGLERVYLFEGLVKTNGSGTGGSPTTRRSSLIINQMTSSFIWEDANFWEDLFCDFVMCERGLIGMDSNIKNLLERYKSLPENEKRLLEHDEDRLLATILYNLIAYMIMMQVNKTTIRKKIQRLLGMCHIGLNYSQELTRLIDALPYLEANDIDLKPVPSRQMCRKTFSVHCGKDASSSVCFIEVRENGLIIRSASGVVTDRWLFEELVNMTYSPKNKVLCLWRRSDGLTEMQKFYTKRCKNLYYCIKEAMESTLIPASAPLNQGQELGGEFPIEELHTGEGGLLKVSMEGVRLLFAQRKLFIRLDHIKKCFTQKGGIFVLEEFNPKTRQLLHRYYTSSMADQICYCILCVFSYLAVGQNNREGPEETKKIDDESINKQQPTG